MTQSTKRRNPPSDATAYMLATNMVSFVRLFTESPAWGKPNGDISSTIKKCKNLKEDAYRGLVQDTKNHVRIKIDETAIKCYIIKRSNENLAIKKQIQSSRNLDDMKEKLKILDVQNKENPTSIFIEFMRPKYPAKRVPNQQTPHTNTQQYVRWNWRNASMESVATTIKEQRPGGSQNPIVFHTRRLRNYEINYTITE
ncbi:hypothetical protein TNCV_3296261 [Trichonephila clavipes]|uniref:Uncharacterized protein n=1 Tax=Trichonephila clavipes TaxID=2585209 RepID=A0A8X6VKC5_TRICX|nr:hypothetical protein TNCV_3296261 [Trichonephila clavipes]